MAKKMSMAMMKKMDAAYDKTEPKKKPAKKVKRKGA